MEALCQMDRSASTQPSRRATIRDFLDALNRQSLPSGAANFPAKKDLAFNANAPILSANLDSMPLVSSPQWPGLARGRATSATVAADVGVGRYASLVRDAAEAGHLDALEARAFSVGQSPDSASSAIRGDSVERNSFANDSACNVRMAKSASHSPDRALVAMRDDNGKLASAASNSPPRGRAAARKDSVKRVRFASRLSDSTPMVNSAGHSLGSQTMAMCDGSNKQAPFGAHSPDKAHAARRDDHAEWGTSARHPPSSARAAVSDAMPFVGEGPSSAMDSANGVHRIALDVGEHAAFAMRSAQAVCKFALSVGAKAAKPTHAAEVVRQATSDCGGRACLAIDVALREAPPDAQEWDASEAHSKDVARDAILDVREKVDAVYSLDHSKMAVRNILDRLRASNAEHGVGKQAKIEDALPNSDYCPTRLPLGAICERLREQLRIQVCQADALQVVVLQQQLDALREKVHQKGAEAHVLQREVGLLREQVRKQATVEANLHREIAKAREKLHKEGVERNLQTEVGALRDGIGRVQLRQDIGVEQPRLKQLEDRVRDLSEQLARVHQEWADDIAQLHKEYNAQIAALRGGTPLDAKPSGPVVLGEGAAMVAGSAGTATVLQ